MDVEKKSMKRRGRKAKAEARAGGRNGGKRLKGKGRRWRERKGLESVNGLEFFIESKKKEKKACLRVPSHVQGTSILLLDSEAKNIYK